MATIKLTGQYAVGAHEYAIVDDDMVEYLSRWRWKAKPNGNGNNVYAVRNARIDGKNVTLRMHRVVAGLDRGNPLEVDHDNHNSLDNRRANLIPSTRSANALNARRVLRCVDCNTCGAPVEREVSAMVSPKRLICAACLKKRGAQPRRSSVFVTACKACEKPVTGRTSLRQYCSEACRCRARYARAMSSGSHTQGSHQGQLCTAILV